MNWGTRIVIAYALFIILVMTMVGYAMRQDVFLVSENYYEEEIAYQEQIDRLSNTQSLKEKVKVNVDQNGHIHLQLPKSSMDAITKGSVHLYRPSDARLDQFFELKPDAMGNQQFYVKDLPHGSWKIKVSWKGGTKDYYFEQDLLLN